MHRDAEIVVYARIVRFELDCLAIVVSRDVQLLLLVESEAKVVVNDRNALIAN